MGKLLRKPLVTSSEEWTEIIMLSDLVICKPFLASDINHIIQLMVPSAMAMLRDLCAALRQLVGETTISFIKMQIRALLEPRVVQV
jgi:hypothetical protein